MITQTLLSHIGLPTFETLSLNPNTTNKIFSKMTFSNLFDWVTFLTFLRLLHTKTHSKLTFYEHTTNHGWCEHGVNIIFNTEIRCTVCKHKLKCKNISKRRLIFPLCSCINKQNLVCNVKNFSNSEACVCSLLQTNAHFQKICSYQAREWRNAQTKGPRVPSFINRECARIGVHTSRLLTYLRSLECDHNCTCVALRKIAMQVVEE